MKALYPVMIATAASTTTVSVVTFETMNPKEKIQSLEDDIGTKKKGLEAKNKDLEAERTKNKKDLEVIKEQKIKNWFIELAGFMRLNKITDPGDTLRLCTSTLPSKCAQIELAFSLYDLEKYAIS